MTLTTWLIERNIDRRSVLKGIGFGAGILALGPLLQVLPAAALTQSQARTLVERVMDELQALINSGRNEAQMIREFEAFFARHGDVAIIARSALGPAARSATPAQLAAFTPVFQSYLARKYGRQFRAMTGARAEVTGAREVQSFWEVISVMHMRGEAPFEVRWQVSDRSGQPRFFNLIVEGVNVLAAERQEIGAMLDRRGGSIERMIEDLRRAG